MPWISSNLKELEEAKIDLGLLLVGSRQVDHQWQIGFEGREMIVAEELLDASSSIFSSSSASSQAEGNWIFCVCRPVYNRGQSVETRNIVVYRREKNKGQSIKVDT